MKQNTSPALRILWCLFLFVLPFRWDYVATAAEQAIFPLNLPEWLLFTILPHCLLAAIVGALLLASLLRYPNAARKDAALCIPILSFAPLLCGLAGLVHTTEIAYAQNWYWHFFVIACTATGLWWTSRADDKLLPWAFHALAIGALFTALEGWTQHFGGLQAMYEAELAHAKETGIALSEQMMAKFQQTRSFGHFADPNAYAAQLLLTCPLLVLDAVRLARRCSSPKTAAWILGGGAAILSAGALFFSGSRGAVLGAVAGVLLAIVFQYGKKLSRTWKCALAVLAILCAGALVLAFNKFSQRKMETVTVRLEYYQTATAIYRRFPLFGAGLGEFFPWHLRLKDWEGDEARDPHSLFFSQLAQCGIPGALDALLRLAAPLLLALGLFRARRSKLPWQTTTILGAWTAWNVHALTQFNDQVISTAILAGFLGLFAFDDTAPQPNAPAGLHLRLCQGVMLLLALIGLSALLKMPSEKTRQIADNAYADRHLSYDTKVQRLQESIRQDTDACLPPKLLADLALQKKDPGTAEEAVAELILRTSHRASSWLRQWRLAVLEGDEQAEQEAMKQMELWYPTSPTLQFLKALPPLNAQTRLRLSYTDLEKLQVTPETVQFSLALPSLGTRIQDEIILAPILRDGILDSQTGRTLQFQLKQ